MDQNYFENDLVLGNAPDDLRIYGGAINSYEIPFDLLRKEILKEDDPILIRVEGGSYGDGHMMTIIGYIKIPWSGGYKTFYLIRDTAVPLNLHFFISETSFESHAKSCHHLTDGQSFLRGNPIL